MQYVVAAIAPIAMGLLFYGLGLPVWHGLSIGVLCLLVNNKLCCGAWRITPWGNLW